MNPNALVALPSTYNLQFDGLLAIIKPVRVRASLYPSYKLQKKQKSLKGTFSRLLGSFKRIHDTGKLVSEFADSFISCRQGHYDNIV